MDEIKHTLIVKPVIEEIPHLILFCMPRLGRKEKSWMRIRAKIY